METDDTPHLEYVDDETKAIGACRAALRKFDRRAAARIVSYLAQWNGERFVKIDEPEPGGPVLRNYKGDVIDGTTEVAGPSPAPPNSTGNPSPYETTTVSIPTGLGPDLQF